MMFANRISSSTNCSIWLPETSPPSSARALLRHSLRSCNTSILTDAKYPDVLVARAFSNSDDLDLVLYPGAKPGPQEIRIERLRPGAKYAMRYGSEQAFTADNNGTASLSVELHGRTPIHIVPAS
jgi:hypothetical protein